MLVCLKFPDDREFQARMQEFQELALSAGARIAGVLALRQPHPSPSCFLSRGRCEALAERVVAEGIELVIFNHSLSPGQERNLERQLKCRVLDRVGLILDIFAQRAQSHEGKLQVELAQLRYLSTRLVRGWTHLERQKGGIGLRGPGETQLEADRRALRMRIKRLQAGLVKVKRQRQQGRAARRRARLPTLVLVGYTNSGKSSLFNCLTHAGAYVADQPFATLDNSLRRVTLDGFGPAVIADTVGFVRELPHSLVQAFQATLQEVREAKLLLHLVDATAEQRDVHLRQVELVLDEIGAAEVPKLLIYNKIDRMDEAPRVDLDAAGKPWRVWVSAATGQGLEELVAVLGQLLGGDLFDSTLQLPPGQGRLRARLYERRVVLGETVAREGLIQLQLRLPREELVRLLRQEGLEPDTLLAASGVG